MQEVLKLLIGILILMLGFPIGNYLKKITLDEQKDGQKWFRILTLTSLLIGFFGLIILNDWLMFSFFFIAIVTSRNLILKNPVKRKR